MADSIIIMLWVYQQWSYARFHAKYLYKLWCYDETNGNGVARPEFDGARPSAARRIFGDKVPMGETILVFKS